MRRTADRRRACGRGPLQEGQPGGQVALEGGEGSGPAEHRREASIRSPARNSATMARSLAPGTHTVAAPRARWPSGGAR